MDKFSFFVLPLGLVGSLGATTGGQEASCGLSSRGRKGCSTASCAEQIKQCCMTKLQVMCFYNPFFQLQFRSIQCHRSKLSEYFALICANGDVVYMFCDKTVHGYLSLCVVPWAT